jgi:hypothetical protein
MKGNCKGCGVGALLHRVAGLVILIPIALQGCLGRSQAGGSLRISFRTNEVCFALLGQISIN